MKSDRLSPQRRCPPFFMGPKSLLFQRNGVLAPVVQKNTRLPLPARKINHFFCRSLYGVFGMPFIRPKN
jgi:hypothetical protein